MTSFPRSFVFFFLQPSLTTFLPDSFPELQQALKWRTGHGVWGKLARDLRLGCAPVPFSPALFPALTWAYPRCLLLLPISRRVRSPPHLARQTCNGPGGAGGCCSRGAPGAFPTPASLTPTSPFAGERRSRAPAPTSSGAPHPRPAPGDSGMISIV